MTTWTAQTKNTATYNSPTKSYLASQPVGGSPMGLLLTITYSNSASPDSLWTPGTKNAATWTAPNKS